MSTTAELRRRPRAGLPLPMLGDARLATLVARGDERAFAALYDRYHQRLYGYCRTIVRHDEDAQDALQATMTSALTALRRSPPDAPVRPWLFRIAHNECVDLLRRRKGTSSLDAVPEPAAPSADDALEARDRLRVLMSDLADLPDRQRGALVMRELSGLSHVEIGAALELGENGAKQAILDARTSLAEFEKGRAMECAEVRPLISAGDGRKLRGRTVRAHLRACEDCRALRDSIFAREQDLKAIAPPLAPTAAAALLAKIVGGGGGGGGTGAGGAGVLSAKAAVGSLAGKAALGTAVVVVGAGAVHEVKTASPKHHRPAPRVASQPKPTVTPVAEVTTPVPSVAAPVPAATARARPAAKPVPRRAKVRVIDAREPAAPVKTPKTVPAVATATATATPASTSNGAAAPGRATNQGKHLGQLEPKATPVHPVKTPKPVRTPKPVKTPKPATTPEPVATATPVATEESHGKGDPSAHGRGPK